MPSCFIVMPISTSDHLCSLYRDDSEHFKHVCEHLFCPAVEKANLTPIPPVAYGSDLIHAEIVKQLESVDLVLCDMSSLNANVFFELGIRTAVNKPVCLVKDSVTPNVPFDTGILNYHTYDASLVPWKLEQEIAKLAEHITKSVERSNGRNTLWSHFGLTKRGELTAPASPTDAKLDLLLDRVESLGNVEKRKSYLEYIDDRNFANRQRILNEYIKEQKVSFEDVDIQAVHYMPDSVVIIESKSRIDELLADRIFRQGEKLGFSVNIIEGTKKSDG